MTHIFDEQTKIINDSDEPISVKSDPVDDKASNLEAIELLENIYIELKKINVHLSTMTDREVTEEDTK